MNNWLRFVSRMALLIAFIGILALALSWGNKQLRMDDCLDKGGAWNAATESCGLVPDAENAPEEAK